MNPFFRIAKRLTGAAREGKLGETVSRGVSYRLRTANTCARDAYVRAGYAVAYFIQDRFLGHVAAVKRYPIPLPELGIQEGNEVTAGKGTTSWEKWRLIETNLPAGARNAMDIGSNNGFFSLRLAQKGLFTIGVEPDLELLRLAQAAALRGNVRSAAFVGLPVSPDNVHQLPGADVTLVLSVAQRWIRMYGREAGLAIVKAIWEKTTRAMFFELPNAQQSSKEADILSYLGDTEAESEAAIIRFLNSLGGGEARLLGYLPSDFRPDEKRHIFVLERRASQ